MVINSQIADNSLLVGKRNLDKENPVASKINASWLRAAAYGFAFGAITLLGGLIVAVSIWLKGSYISELPVGNLATGLMLASFAIFFFGSYCLDKAYSPIYRKTVVRKSDKNG